MGAASWITSSNFYITELNYNGIIQWNMFHNKNVTETKQTVTFENVNYYELYYIFCQQIKKLTNWHKLPF